MDYPGNLFVIAAPSGAGKSSLVSALLQIDGHLVVSISHTTRAPRGQERDGREYHFVDEAAAYAIRIDIAEELARLRSHLDEIGRLLAAGGEVGKRLDFLVQELLREANTLASKAASIELTNLAIEMKVAIEQMREQVQNLE